MPASATRASAGGDYFESLSAAQPASFGVWRFGRQGRDPSDKRIAND
jgi:hypothetical protein